MYITAIEINEGQDRARRERAAMIEAEKRMTEENSRLREAEERQARIVEERAAADRLETARAALRKCEAIARELVERQTQVNNRLNGAVYLQPTDDIARLLCQREALELQILSANGERPALLRRFMEAENQHARAKEQLKPGDQLIKQATESESF